MHVTNCRWSLHSHIPRPPQKITSHCMGGVSSEKSVLPPTGVTYGYWKRFGLITTGSTMAELRAKDGQPSQQLGSCIWLHNTNNVGGQLVHGLDCDCKLGGYDTKESPPQHTHTHTHAHTHTRTHAHTHTRTHAHTHI